MTELRRTDTFPLALADRCVACGLCLPHCPTYRKTRDENESPRGRISLMRALVRDELPLTPRLEAHLARCLVCRACENVCPSHVPYGDLIDSARAVIENRRRHSWHRRLLRHLALGVLVARPRVLALLTTLLRLYQVSRIQSLVRGSGILRLLRLDAWEAELPPLPSQTSWREYYPAIAPTRGRVALFLGCIAKVTDRETLASAIAVLNRIGYDVAIPKGQTCCGAVHRHHGEAQIAAALRARNLDAFDVSAVDAIVYTASGCGSTLAEYGKVIDDRRAHAFADKVRDISQFLDAAWPSTMDMRPLDKTIAVHDPCSLTNILRLQGHPYSLLRRIPGARVIALPDNASCCGFAGAYHLTQPDLSRALRADKLQSLRTLRPDILASSNGGCAAYLANGLRDESLTLRVAHPVTLLAEQLLP